MTISALPALHYGGDQGGGCRHGLLYLLYGRHSSCALLRLLFSLTHPAPHSIRRRSSALPGSLDLLRVPSPPPLVGEAVGGWRPCGAGLLLGLRFYRGLGAIHISDKSHCAREHHVSDEKLGFCSHCCNMLSLVGYASR